MKRRQVVTGLLAFTALGTVPRSMWQSSNGETVPLDTGMTTFTDVDPSFHVEPLMDSERRRAPLSPEFVVETDKVPQGSVVAKPMIPVSGETAEEKHTVAQQAELPPLDERQVSAPAVTSDKSSVTQEKLASMQHSAQDKSPSTSEKQIRKNIDFEKDYDDDIFVSRSDQPLLHSVALRLKNLQNTIGYGNFNIVSFDEALIYGKRFSAVGAFTAAELEFIEKIFATQAAQYGFYGDKVTDNLTIKIPKKEVYKVPHTGHYLFKGDSLAYYEKIRQSVGGNIILTSGIRSNVKQLHLFLAKTIRVNGNISRASRSLAPPGYSYHGIGDFDVGRAGWGVKNFSGEFAQTDEFKRMQDLGYIAIRYDRDNQLGVRFEPWHIQVV